MCTLKITQYIRKINVDKYYVITGDEYSHELVETTNDFFKRPGYMSRINSQLIDFSHRIKSPWAINSNDFPINIYGELNPKEIGDKLNPELSIFNPPNSIGNIVSSTRPSTNNPINSTWFIDFIKSITELPNIDYEYLELLKIISRIDVSSYEDMIKVINDFPVKNSIILKEQYLVLIGAKYFTRDELIKYFLYDHNEYLNDIRDKINNNTYSILLYKLENNIVTISNPNIVNDFFSLNIQNIDIFDQFYRTFFHIEAYIKHIDVLIALGITNIEGRSSNPLFPETMTITKFSFKLQ